MRPYEDDDKVQEDIKKLLSGWRSHELPEAKTSEFIARLYKVSEERKHIVGFSLPFRAPAFAYAMASLFVGVMVYQYAFAPVYPVVTNVEGTVKVYSASKNEWSVVEGGDTKLRRNDIVKTFGDGRADIIARNLYHVRMKRDSELTLAQASSRALPGAIRYELAKGKAFAYYDKARAANREFRIETTQATATAVGTDFMVESMPQFGNTWVGVLEGAVRVTASDVSVMVRPGEKTTVRGNTAPDKPARLEENELLEMEELYRIGTKPQVALLISAGKSRTRELLAATPLYISSRKEDILPEKMRSIIETLNRAVKGRSKETYLENIHQFEELLEKYPNPKYNIQFSLFIAAYYEHLDEHQKAIEAFNRVIEKYPGSNLASIARCAIGLIYEEKLADAADARAAYRKVLSDYPQSPEAEEAIAGLSRLSGK